MIKTLHRVVVTGMGAITPLGNSVPELWNNCIAGKSGIGPITKFDTTHFKTKIAGEVKNFKASDYFEKNEERKYDLFTHYAIGASEEGKKNAGPIAQFEKDERFRWLTAVKSSSIQTSRPHSGFSSNLDQTFEKLYQELVL